MTASHIFRSSLLPALGAGIVALVTLQAFATAGTGAFTSGTAGVQSELAYADLWRGNPQVAVARLGEALRGDPASAERWLDLADALVESGRVADARRCIKKGIAASPGLPHIRMRAANLYFRLGDTAEGTRNSADAAAASSEYRETVFQAWARLGGGTEAVFRAGIHTTEIAREYLRWLIRNGYARESGEVWSRLDQTKAVTRGDALAYSAFLVSRQEYEPAAKLYREHLGRASNLALNGSFETESDSAAADWEVEADSGVLVEADRSGGREGTVGLRLRFSGTNPDYHHLRQRIPVSPGVYRLSGVLRSEGLTSKQGVGLRLGDAVDASRYAVTRAVTGDQPWTAVDATLSVGPGSRLLEVAVIRRASWTFDAALSGTVWIDDIRLLRVKEGS